MKRIFVVIIVTINGQACEEYERCELQQFNDAIYSTEWNSLLRRKRFVLAATVYSQIVVFLLCKK